MLILICCSVAQSKKVKMGTCRSRKNSDHFQTTKRRIPRMASPTQIPRKMTTGNGCFLQTRHSESFYGYAFLAGKQMRGNIICEEKDQRKKTCITSVMLASRKYSNNWKLFIALESLSTITSRNNLSCIVSIANLGVKS